MACIVILPLAYDEFKNEFAEVENVTPFGKLGLMKIALYRFSFQRI